MFAGYYRQPRDVDEVIGLVGLAEKRDAHVKTLSGGQSGGSTSASRSSATRAGLPRRADDGLRPGGAPGRLGPGPLAALARQDHPPDDPLSRRGAAAGRPRRCSPRGEIVRIGKPSELTASAGVEIRYRRLGEQVCSRRTIRPARCTSSPERRWPPGSSSRRSRCGAPRSRTCTWNSSVRRTSEPVLPSAAAEQLRLAQPRGVIFVFLFPPLLFLLLGSVYGDGNRRGAGDELPAGRDAGVRRREHRVRRAGDPARDPARVRDPEADSLDPASRQRLPRLRAGVELAVVVLQA